MDALRTVGILLLTALAAPVACSEELAPPEPARSTIGTTVFARTLSDLVVARIELLPDTAAYEWRTGEILDRNGVTPAELRSFVETHGQDDDRMTKIYARVSARLDSLYPTTRPGGAETEAALDSLVGAAGGSGP
jgi:hypothetical protein